MGRRIHRPLKVVRSHPKTNKDVLKELKERQSLRKIEATVPVIKPKPATSPIIKKVEEVKVKVKEKIKEPKKIPIPKTLCVGTIFIKCDDLGHKWFDLQSRYLKETTENYHYVTVVQTGEASPEFENNSEVIIPDGSGQRNSRAHVKGLQTLHQYFLKHQEDYEHFLFIDMDAFPIRKGWYDILSKKTDSKKWEIATALRCENLETRLHSSILFTPQRYLSQLDWGVQKVGPDLVGKQESDVCIKSYQHAKRDKAFVMLRSNQYQIHPLLCGIYYDLFYHHGCGSGRTFNMRSKPYWGHVVPQKFDVMNTIDQLMEDPNEFIGKLAGWNREQYPQV